MAKRHMMAAGDWESIIGRLQELVLANSGEDAFQEIFKILVAKLVVELDERHRQGFAAGRCAHDTANSINSLLAIATKKWPGIIEGTPRSRLTDEHLAICVEAIADHSISDTNLEVLDGLFEYLVSHVAKGSKGQYFTPRQIVDCCVRIIDPQPHELVADPACGSAGFLVHVLNHVRSSRQEEDERTYCQTCLWGFDFDRRAIQVAKALMLVAGDGSANLYQLNSLLPQGALTLLDAPPEDHQGPRLTVEDVMRTKARGFRGFDVILTNPPFAGEIREAHILDAYQLARQGRRIERDVLFLERCVALLRPGGRLGIVLPHNKFGGSGWAYLRKWVLRNLRVVAVLGLDRNTFLPHTHQKTSVLFGIRRERVVRNPRGERVLFLISESSGKDSKGKLILRAGCGPNLPAWERAAHDLQDAVNQFQSFVKEEGIAWRP